MSEHSTSMVFATDMVHGGPVRISGFKDIRLPFTISIPTLFGTAAGLVLALPVAAIANTLFGLTGLLVTIGCGGAGGWYVAEKNMFRTILTRGKWATKKTKGYEGEGKVVYLGICQMDRVPSGPIYLIAADVAVPAGSVDDFCAPITTQNTGLFVREKPVERDLYQEQPEEQPQGASVPTGLFN